MSVERRLSRSLHACLKGEEVDGDATEDEAFDGSGNFYLEDLTGLRWEDLLMEAEAECNGENDTSYEKACRRGSGGHGAIAPGVTPTPVPSGSPSRLAAFFFSSKRSLRASPLKRARSAAKLAPRAPLRSSRSHESLLSQPAACAAGVRGGSVRALHASLAGRPHCFLLHLPGPPPHTRYFACGSRLERDTWINSLKASLQAEGANSVRRTERSLRLYLLEAKGLAPKKRYYCELMLDATLYARTSSKLKTELCFWGEVFEFSGLPHVNVITIDVYREPDRKPRKRDKRCLVGSVKIPVHELTGRHQSERWHQILTSSGEILPPPEAGGTMPSLRVKCRYQQLEVLPEHSYDPLLSYLRDNYGKLLEYLEPVIGVKSKEEVAGALVGAVRGAGGAGAAARLLASAAALEVRRAPHAALAFRANSLATKATEAYMKMLGETYLQETLCESVNGAMGSGSGTNVGAWEVDPARGAGAGGGLKRQRSRLRGAVTRAWRAVKESAPNFPHDLKICFAAFREKLQSMDREELTDHLVSASVFLRFLCPAILSPSLFGITHEYPDERAGRNLTLMAKALQTLANFTRFQGKEAFMEFLNDFLEEEAANMRIFLNQISTVPAGSEGCLHEEWGTGTGAGYLDLGRQLAALHLLLADSVPRLPPSALKELDPLPSILQRLTEQLEQVTGSQLDLDIHSSPAMHDNIFRFNDPTYSPGSNESAVAHGSPLLHRSTALQINSITSTSTNHSNPASINPSAAILSHHNAGVKRSPSLGIRAATLPRNNNNTYNTLLANNAHPQQNSDRYSSQYNNREHFVNMKVVQIGLDGKNASTPSLAAKNIGSNGSLSQRSNRMTSDVYNQPSRAVFIENGDRSNGNYNTDQLYSRTPLTEPFNNNNMPTNLDELSDLLRYADDQDAENNCEENNIINQRIIHGNNNAREIVPQSGGVINIVNGGHLAGHGHHNNGGSNVSISALSNVASSGYQSIATYSQSSSPVELYGGQPNNNVNNFCDGSPAHNARRPGQTNLENNRRNNYGKSSQQRFEYERQKFGIQNFTRDTGANSPRPTTAAPLTFTNPVYHVDERIPLAARDDDGSHIIRQLPKRSVSTTSSSSVEEDDDTTDNVETNSEGNFKNYRDRNAKHPRRNVRDGKQTKTTGGASYLTQEQREALRHSKSNMEPQPQRRLLSKSRSNGSECSGMGNTLSIANNVEVIIKNKPADVMIEPVAPLRRGANSRLPRTNPLLSYNQNMSNQNNLTHFGLNSTESQPYQTTNNNHAVANEASRIDVRFINNRPDSNVEETNKEMYRLQMSRSQKAIFDRNNLDNYSNSNLPRMLEKYDANNKNNLDTGYGTRGNSDSPIEKTFVKSSNNNLNEGFGVLRVTENGYPIERNYSKTNINSIRSNEELSQNGYPLGRSCSKSNVSSSRLNEDLNGYPSERSGGLYVKRTDDDVNQILGTGLEQTQRHVIFPKRDEDVEGIERAVRRLSLEGVQADSSSEQEDGSYHTAGRRRLPKNHRTIHQYEREIERLKCSVDELRQKLESADMAEEPSARGTDIADSKMKGIISRLLGVEDELRREQRAMAVALNRKQRVIERQGQRLAALGAANARLLSALHHLQPSLPSNSTPSSQSSSSSSYHHNSTANNNANLISTSEQLLNNLQSDLQPILYQNDKEYLNSQDSFLDSANSNGRTESRYQVTHNDSSTKNSTDKLTSVNGQNLQVFNVTDRTYGSVNNRVDSRYQSGLPSPNTEKTSDKLMTNNNNAQLLQVFNSDKTNDSRGNSNPGHQLYVRDKSPVNHHPFYHEKSDHHHHHLLRTGASGIERSSSNQHLEQNKSPLRQLATDTRHQLFQHDKNILSLHNNDQDNYQQHYTRQNDNGQELTQRNSDPITSRHYSSRDSSAVNPNSMLSHRSLTRQGVQDNSSASQFVPMERPLLPAEGHQALVSTQPAIYYGNS